MSQGRWSTVLRFLHPHRWRLIGLMLLTALLSVLAMLPPLLIRAVINRVIVGGERARLPALGAIMLLVPLLHALCGFVQVLGVSHLGQAFVMDLRGAVYRHLLSLSMRFFGKHSVGKLVNRLMGDSGVIQQILGVASVQVVSDLVCSAFAVTVTFALNWRLALVLVLMVVLFVANYRLNIEPIRRATRQYRGAEDRLAGGVQNRLVADLTVKTFGAERREHNIFRDQSEESLALTRRGGYATSAFTLNTMLLRDLGRIVVYFLGCAMVLRGDIGYGDVIAFTTYSMQLLMPAVRFSMIAQQIQDARISADRLFELLDEQPEVRARPGAVRLGRARGEVAFDHVSFSYEEGRPVLQDIDFRAAPGETVALVGPTGCGKSTVISLLLRFYDVREGAVRIDGTDIRDVNPASLRSQFGIVLQESLLFDVSVAENIRYSRREASREDIRRAARVAEIHDLILSLPGGYDSELGSHHAQLSVGQKQRISIARAVLADPAILIMDEATSALDSESERAIQRAMGRFLKGRTAFVVAHRLSTIRNADRIILLGEGRIREMGTHAQLMAVANGTYRELYETHAAKGVITDE